MSENNNNVELTNEGHQSKLTFDEQVISKIVQMAMKNVDGAMLAKGGSGAFSGIVGRGNNDGINVEVGEIEVAIDLNLVLEYGKNAKDVYTKIKTEIEQQVNSMTGLKVVEVNAKIDDVLSSEEFKARKEA